MKTKLLAVMFLAGGTAMFAQTRFSVGVNAGGFGAGYYQSAPSSYYQAAAAPYGYEAPPCPGPDYSFVDGYWSEYYGRRLWVPGFWERRAFIGRNNGSRFEGSFDNRFNDR